MCLIKDDPLGFYQELLSETSQEIGRLQVIIKNLENKAQIIEIGPDTEIDYYRVWATPGKGYVKVDQKHIINLDREGYKKLLRLMLEYWVDDSDRLDEVLQDIGLED